MAGSCQTKHLKADARDHPRHRNWPTHPVRRESDAKHGTSLQSRLDVLKAGYAKVPLHATLMRRCASEQLLASRLAKRAVRAGDRAPSFRLRDGNGVQLSPDDMVSADPVLVVF
jgi:hypothetical protein